MNKLVFLGCIGLMSFCVSAADINAGKEKSVTCAGCHGSSGISSIPVYPNLAGQNPQYLEKQLKAFRDGKRKNPIMSPMAKPLNDTDIANLAAYFSSIK